MPPRDPVLPAGYHEVLCTDTPTAQRWELTCQKLGLDVEVVEATGDARERGEWQLCAREHDEARVRSLVEAVAAGRVQLLGGSVLRSGGFRALAVVAVLLGLVVGGLLLAWASGKL